MKVMHFKAVLILLVVGLLGIVQMVYAWPGVDANGGGNQYRSE